MTEKKIRSAQNVTDVSFFCSVMCDRRATKYGYKYSSAKNTIIQAKSFPVVSTSHKVSHCQTFSFVYTSHTVAPRKMFLFAGTSHTIFPVKSFVMASPSHTILIILSFALLNASHMVHRRNYVAKAIHHTQLLCGKHLRKVA